MWYAYGYMYLLKTRNHSNTHCLGVPLFYSGVFKPSPLQTLLLFACTPENICYSLKTNLRPFTSRENRLKSTDAQTISKGDDRYTTEYGEIWATLFVGSSLQIVYQSIFLTVSQ